MSHHIDIPESVASSIRLPEAEIERCLRIELAIALYSQNLLPFGKASELADLPGPVFAQHLSERNIPRHYTDEELTQDLEYARGQ